MSLISINMFIKKVKYFPFYHAILDLSGASDTPISRRKSFKKSLRESFRRLRKGRSQRRTNANSPTRNTTSEKKKET